MKNCILLGLAIGDAFGGPYEFKRKGDYVVSEDYSTGGNFSLSKGEYTDDTSMALCLANSLIERQTFDIKDQLTKYLNWYKKGYMSTRNHCFDIGGQTRSALEHFKYYGKYSQKENYHAGGNGTIMRLGPIAMFYKTKKEVLLYSGLSAEITHYNEFNIECSQFFGYTLFLLLNNKSKQEVLRLLKEEEWCPLLKEVFSFEEELPTGYVLNTLKVAFKGFFEYDNFLDGLKYVVSLGEDADTVGAVYGQMAGAFYGFEGIPQHLKDGLMNYSLIEEISENLINA